jgi:hypothetical protein
LSGLIESDCADGPALLALVGEALSAEKGQTSIRQILANALGFLARQFLDAGDGFDRSN